MSTMNAKLTLSMDASVTERAKQPARARNSSVSAMLAGLVRGLGALDHPRGPDFIGPLTRAATGLVDLDAVSADADLLGEALWERYGDDCNLDTNPPDNTLYRPRPAAPAPGANGGLADAGAHRLRPAARGGRSDFSPTWPDGA
jgi:hypothetical protein